MKLLWWFYSFKLSMFPFLVLWIYRKMLYDIFNNILIIISLCASESTNHNLSIEARVITNIFEILNLWIGHQYARMQLTSLRYSGIVSRTPIIFFTDAGTLITKQGRSEQQLFIISFIGIRFVLNARNLDPSVVHSWILARNK